jgi:hypothetical protein
MLASLDINFCAPIIGAYLLQFTACKRDCNALFTSNVNEPEAMQCSEASSA